MGKYAVSDVYGHGEGKQTREHLSTSPLGNLEALEMVRTIRLNAKRMTIALADLKDSAPKEWNVKQISTI